MIFDLSPFSGEYDTLELRLNVLSPYVDKFIICEGTETFSGRFKPLYWVERNKDRFEEWEDKIVYKIIDKYDDAEVLTQMAERVDYVDQPHFQRAFYQKEMLRKVLAEQNPDDEDIIYYGDTDEVWKPKEIDDQVYKLKQLAYSYYLNNRSPEDWRGTIVTKYKNLKNGCLNDMRANPVNILEDGGWHFTNMGGLDAIKTKIEAYDHQEVNIPIVKDGLEERLTMNVDYLGRGFKFWKDESELPQYVLDHKRFYKEKGLWKS